MLFAERNVTLVLVFTEDLVSLTIICAVQTRFYSPCPPTPDTWRRCQELGSERFSVSFLLKMIVNILHQVYGLSARYPAFIFSPCFTIQKQNYLNKRWNHISTTLHNHVRNVRVRQSASSNWRRLTNEHIIPFMVPSTSTLPAMNLQPPTFVPTSV